MKKSNVIAFRLSALIAFIGTAGNGAHADWVKQSTGYNAASLSVGATSAAVAFNDTTSNRSVPTGTASDTVTRIFYWTPEVGAASPPNYSYTVNHSFSTIGSHTAYVDPTSFGPIDSFGGTYINGLLYAKLQYYDYRVNQIAGTDDSATRNSIQSTSSVWGFDAGIGKYVMSANFSTSLKNESTVYTYSYGAGGGFLYNYGAGTATTGSSTLDTTDVDVAP